MVQRDKASNYELEDSRFESWQSLFFPAYKKDLPTRTERHKMSRTPSNIFVVGPSGSGKTVFVSERTSPRTSSPAGVGVPAQNVSRSPIPSVRGLVAARPTQGGKQPRRRPPPPPPSPDGDGDDSGPSNGGDTSRSRRSGVPSDRGDLQDAFDQMSDRERQRLRKKNVQSVTHTSTITTV